ncbi:MAG: hypothetical protein NTV80_06505 [Verrucomicrobia bacterium]|nr:hypothetical protein [Verrucomicrobiota bacterium]
MKPKSTSTLQRLAFTALAACLISSCSLPPRDAWRVVQKDGLFNLWAGNYSTNYSGQASASPFQTSQPYVAPRPINQVPYRTTYHSNRYRVADYNRVPYRPKTVASSQSRRSTTARPKDYNKPRAHSGSNVSPSSSVVTKSDPVKPVPTTASAPTPSAPAAPKPAETLPYGAPVNGRPGMVTSPFAQKQQLVDVTGLAPGDTVKDPYSGKLFKVPPTQTAAAPAPAKPTSEAPPAADSKSVPSQPTPSAPAAPATGNP